jgi:hypothetical protein
VEFYNGTTRPDTATLVTVDSVTTARFTITTKASGTHKIRAVYDGDTNDLTQTPAPAGSARRRPAGHRPGFSGPGGPAAVPIPR